MNGLVEENSYAIHYSVLFKESGIEITTPNVMSQNSISIWLKSNKLNHQLIAIDLPMKRGSFSWYMSNIGSHSSSLGNSEVMTTPRH